MKINKNQILKDIISGDNLKEPGKDGKEKDMTLGNIVATILLTTPSTDTGFAYTIAFRIINEKEKDVELSPEEIVFIKAVMKTNEKYYPIVTGQIISILG